MYICLALNPLQRTEYVQVYILILSVPCALTGTSVRLWKEYSNNMSRVLFNLVNPFCFGSHVCLTLKRILCSEYFQAFAFILFCPFGFGRSVCLTLKRIRSWEPSLFNCFFKKTFIREIHDYFTLPFVYLLILLIYVCRGMIEPEQVILIFVLGVCRILICPDIMLPDTGYLNSRYKKIFKKTEFFCFQQNLPTFQVAISLLSCTYWKGSKRSLIIWSLHHLFNSSAGYPVQP